MEEQPLKPITVLGAGAWGTALALHLAREGQTVWIWSIEVSEIAAMLAERANNQFLPGFPFPESLKPTANLAEAVNAVDDILIAVPSVGFRDTLNMLKPLLEQNARIICATKGLDADSGQLLSEMVEELFGQSHSFAVLSGPSFAREVAEGKPCAVSIASRDQSLLNDLYQRFDRPHFRIQLNHDVIGTELGGVVKNVIAIAAGIADGMSLGANARSALITQGLQEMIRLGLALGARLETFTGLSGIGDLMLTCGDDQSRNRRFGLALGKGQSFNDAAKAVGKLVEGKRNAELVVMLAEQHHVKMPVCEAVWALLQNKISTKEAMEQCFSGF